MLSVTRQIYGMESPTDTMWGCTWAPHLMLTQLAPITTTLIARGIVEQLADRGIVEQLADRGIVEQLIAPQYLFEVVLTSKYLCSYNGMITG